MFLDGIRQAIGSVVQKVAGFVHQAEDHLPSLPLDSLNLSQAARDLLDRDDSSHFLATAIPGLESGGFKPIMFVENRSGRGRGYQPGGNSVLA